MDRWYEKEGRNSDVVLASRVRLARNVENYNFSFMLDDADANIMINDIVDKLQDEEAFKKMKHYNFNGLNAYQKLAMKERHCISSFLENQDYAAGFVSPDEEMSIMINEEDHVRIQSFKAGMNIKEAYAEADRMDDCIGEKLSYSYDEKFGYLTTCPSNAGTGMRASYLLFLPVLGGNDKISGLVSEVGRFGLTLRAMEGDNKKALGDIYQLSNQVTLGKSEKEIMINLDNIAEQIISQERSLREQYFSQRKCQAEDLIYRSYGVLKYARRLSLKDGMLLLSQIKLGISMGIISPVKKDEENIYPLMIGIHPANLILLNEKEFNSDELDIARAEYVRQNLPEIR